MKTKSIGDDLLSFLTPLQKIKFIKRQGWVDRGVESDTIASHTMDTLFIGMYLARKENADENKIIKILMMHDLVMGYMEDVTPQSGKYESKRDLENKAFEKVLECIPEEFYSEYKEMWKDFQNGNTFEAKLAREADKLGTLYQGLFYEEKYKKEILKEFLETYRELFKSKTAIEIYNYLVNKS